MQSVTEMAKTMFMILLVSYIASQVTAQGNATIYGYIRDDVSGMPYTNREVKIFSSDDHTTPEAITQTNASGYYSMQVPAGRYYNVVVQIGEGFSDSSMTGMLAEGGVNQVNFIGHVETHVETRVIEKYGFWMVVVVAFVILGIIFADQIFLRKKRLLSELEQEKQKIEAKLEQNEKIDDVDDISKLKKERDQVEYMINLTKIKFHKRKIDEESFREIARDYQKKLIEIEAKLDRLKK